MATRRVATILAAGSCALALGVSACGGGDETSGGDAVTGVNERLEQTIEQAQEGRSATRPRDENGKR